MARTDVEDMEMETVNDHNDQNDRDDTSITISDDNGNDSSGEYHTQLQ